ncbi:MAG: hypothetical protein ACK5Y2_06840 [Bdellovibrionales bacterium]
MGSATMMTGQKKLLFRNQSGLVTADFLFSFLLISLLTSFLFALCFTFTVVELAQYVSFSAARAAVPAQKDSATQKQKATERVAKLLANPELAPLFRNGWFELSLKDIRLGETPSDYYEMYESRDRKNVIETGQGSSFYIPAAGVRLTLRAKILELNLGPLGKIESESGNGFNLTIGSMLFREPSQEECQQLIRERYQKIVNPPNGGTFPYSSIAGQTLNAYVPMEDNGC